MTGLKATPDFRGWRGLCITPIILLGLLSVFAFDILSQTTPQYGIRDKTPNRVLFTNARIIISPELTFDSGTMFIEDDRVVAVGEDIGDVTGATVVDLKGLSIYPGFIDAYTNYGVEKPRKKTKRSSKPQYLGDRVGGSAWNEAIHAEQDWVDSFRPDSQAAREFMKQGFTTVMSVRQDGVLRGRGFVTTLGSGLPNDLVLRPRHHQCASFDKGSSKQEYPGSLMGSIALLRQVFLDVEWYQTAHTAYAQNPNQEKPEFNAAIEALAPLDDEGLIFETDNELSLIRADRVAREFGIPVVHVGSGREYSAIDQIKLVGPILILPLDYPEAPNVQTIEDELDVSLADLRHWEMAPSNPSLVSDAGLSFALTTHKLKKKPGFLTNVRKAVKRGLSPESALASLTTVPAEICEISDIVGTLEPGKLANFIVCDGDLFEEDASVHSVWIQGHEYELEPIPKVDLRGCYALNVDELMFDLIIKGTLTKPNGEYKIGEKDGKLDYFRAEEDKLDFNIRLDTLGVDGALRFSGRFAHDTLVGLCHFPNGAEKAWVAARIADHVEKPDTSSSGEPEALVSRVTFPNQAFVSPVQPKQVDVLIQSATIWTSEDDGVLPDRDLLIRNGRIAAIGVGLEVPDGVEIVDASGMHITAGLIDAHSHLAISGDVNEGTEAISSEVRLGDVINPYDTDIYRQLAGGLTTIHTLHGSANPIGGQVQVIKLKWGGTDEDMKFDTAPPSIKFALGENVKQSNWGEKYRTRYPQSRTGVEALIRDAFQSAREYETNWQDYQGLNSDERRRVAPPRRDLELEPLVEVLNSRMFVACHAYVQSEMLMLIRLAEEYGFTVRSFEHGLEAYKIASELAAAPTGVATFSDWWAYKFEVYEAIPHNAALLVEKGVLTAVKSDSRELARRLNQEAAKSIMYTDISQEEALKMVTIYPARLLMVQDRIGSIKEGKDADFVIWNGNPLSIYSRPEQTWIEGRKYFDVETDRVLRDDLLREKNALIQKVIKSGKKPGKSPPDKNAKDEYGPGTIQAGGAL